MTHSTAVEVSRASHVWLGSQFQMGLAQIMPITNVFVVNTRPTRAAARASRSPRMLSRHRYATLPHSTTAKQANAASAEPTCR